MTSNKVKHMTACKGYYGWSNIIEEGEGITINHITSLILYTDLSEFSRNFSSTFRQCTRNETIQSIKRRNSKYWWQSKFITEAVKFYGYDSYGKHKGYYNKERGPFYSGIDMILCVCSYSMRLRGPTSTSKHIEVAINFSKREGIIISLDNTGYQYANQLPFIDCSWFSRYPDEVCFIYYYYIIICVYLKIII